MNQAKRMRYTVHRWNRIEAFVKLPFLTNRARIFWSVKEAPNPSGVTTFTWIRRNFWLPLSLRFNMHNCWWNYSFVTDLVVKSWVRWSSTSGLSVNSSFPHDGAWQKPLLSLQSSLPFVPFQIFCPVSSVRPSKVFCFVIHLSVRNECVHLQTRNLIICRQNNNMPCQTAAVFFDSCGQSKPPER